MSESYVVGDLAALLLTGDSSNNSLRSAPPSAEAEAEAEAEADVNMVDSSEAGSESEAEEDGAGESKEASSEFESEDEPEPEGERARRTVFVGNLPMSLGVPKLRSMFSPFGAIESVRFRSIAVADHRIPKKVAVNKQLYLPQRTSKNAYVVFKEASSVGPALSLNGNLVQGHHIRVDRADSDSVQFPPDLTVFVGNLPFDIEDEDLWQAFESCGKIVGVRVVRDKHYGIGKGFAFVSFENATGVKAAIALNETPLKERPLRVYRASAAPSGGHKKSAQPPKRGQKRGAAGADRGKGSIRNGAGGPPRSPGQSASSQRPSKKPRLARGATKGGSAPSAGGSSWQGAQSKPERAPALKRSKKSGR